MRWPIIPVLLALAVPLCLGPARVEAQSAGEAPGYGDGDAGPPVPGGPRGTFGPGDTPGSWDWQGRAGHPQGGWRGQPGASPLGRAGIEAGRFTLQPVEGGLMRLDARTGAMTFCAARGPSAGPTGGWSCALVPEERSAYEAEIARLNARIAALQHSAVPPVMAPPRNREDAAPGDDADPDTGAAPGEERRDGWTGESPSAGEPSAGQSTSPDEARARAAFDKAMRLAEDAFRRFTDMVQRLREDSKDGPAAKAPPAPQGEEKL